MNPVQALAVSSRRFGRACPTLRAMGAPGPGSGIWRPREIETGVFKWGYRYIGFFASILTMEQYFEASLRTEFEKISLKTKCENSIVNVAKTVL